jgi:hypothetical protein
MGLPESRFVTDHVTGCDRPGRPISPQQFVERMVYAIVRLEEAGSALLALPMSGYGTGMRVGSLDVVRELIEAYGWNVNVMRPAPPSAAAITRMDEALGWLTYIDGRNHMLRRIVGARCLVNPVTGRHLFSWRRLGSAFAADYRAIQRWHSIGIENIVARLHRDGFVFPT